MRIGITDLFKEIDVWEGGSSIDFATSWNLEKLFEEVTGESTLDYSYGLSDEEIISEMIDKMEGLYSYDWVNVNDDVQFIVKKWKINPRLPDSIKKSLKLYLEQKPVEDAI